MIKNVAYRARTDRQTQGQTDKKVKSEGPIYKILSNDILCFKTVIISGPIKINLLATEHYDICITKLCKHMNAKVTVNSCDSAQVYKNILWYRYVKRDSSLANMII